jgi:methylthioribulose-1-phosphate dehydratase
MHGELEQAAAEIVRAAHFLAARGWAPAGSGNYSRRLAGGGVAITVSGAHKAFLTEADVMTLSADGRSEDGRRPSDETALHLAVYARFPAAQAVLHTHSIPAAVLTRPGGANLRLEDYELLKAFPGLRTHDAGVDLPIFDNSQDMPALAEVVRARLADDAAPAFLIRGHGLYGWGDSVDQALRVVEAAETLLACELEERRR